MLKTTSYDKLASVLELGHVYRRDMLAAFSKSIDRDLSILTSSGFLEKIGSGLYYRPNISRFGALPPKAEDIVKIFLRDEHFLLYSWNQYNSLGLGLTQIYNNFIVYNFKRFGKFEIANIKFDFRRPARGFPEKLTPEFLIVDLVNNLSELTEDVSMVKENITKNISHYNKDMMLSYATKYGKVSTQKFFRETLHY